MEEEYLFPLKRHRALDPEAADKIAYCAASQAVERDNEARTPYNPSPTACHGFGHRRPRGWGGREGARRGGGGGEVFLTVLAVRGTLGAAQIDEAVQQIARAHHAALRDAAPRPRVRWGTRSANTGGCYFRLSGARWQP